MIPLVYTKDPGRFWGFAIPPLAMGGGRGWADSGEAGGAHGRGRGLRGGEAHLGPIDARSSVGEEPMASHGGGRQRRPRCAVAPATACNAGQRSNGTRL
jgi:hypothetical protein